MQHLVTALQGVAQLVKLGLSTNQKVQKHGLQVAKLHARAVLTCSRRQGSWTRMAKTHESTRAHSYCVPQHKIAHPAPRVVLHATTGFPCPRHRGHAYTSSTGQPHSRPCPRDASPPSQPCTDQVSLDEAAAQISQKVLLYLSDCPFLMLWLMLGGFPLSGDKPSGLRANKTFSEVSVKG